MQNVGNAVQSKKRIKILLVLTRILSY